MSEKMTKIRVRDAKNIGFGDWGEKTRAEMVKIFRLYADDMREKVAAIDATKDEDFEIRVVRGVHVEHFIKNIP